MQDKVLKNDKLEVYEIGYLLVSSIPAEKVTAETESLREILSKNGATMISEEAPEIRTLAYKIKAYDQGYFGWFKFELPKSDIAVVKKAFEVNPNVLRILIISTIKENTYLGKKSPLVTIVEPKLSEIAPVITPSTIEEMDKSIDEMVKEA